jgi:hypothetical protein
VPSHCSAASQGRRGSLAGGCLNFCHGRYLESLDFSLSSFKVMLLDPTQHFTDRTGKSGVADEALSKKGYCECGAGIDCHLSWEAACQDKGPLPAHHPTTARLPRLLCHIFIRSFSSIRTRPLQKNGSRCLTMFILCQATKGRGSSEELAGHAWSIQSPATMSQAHPRLSSPSPLPA